MVKSTPVSIPVCPEPISYLTSISIELKLMHKLGAEIPKLKSRAERLAKEAVKRKQLEERVSESSPQTTAPKKASKGKKRQ